MLPIEQHFENFLSTKLNYEPEDFYCQVTIKFFKRNDPTLQNAVLVSLESKAIVDMKIEDEDVFKSIIDTFGSEVSQEGGEEKKSLQLNKKIDIMEFVEKIISIEDDSILGFISIVEIKSQKRVPGSQCLNYTLN